MKKKPAPKPAPEVHNNTEFTQEQINGFAYLGKTVSNWRQRDIALFQHPTEADKVISHGITFDGQKTVICVEEKTAWATALDYAARGKVYTSE